VDRGGDVVGVQRLDLVHPVPWTRQASREAAESRGDDGRDDPRPDDRRDQPRFPGLLPEFSLSLFPWCGGAVILATVVHIVVLPGAWWRGTLRVIAWVTGLFIWFAGGIVSFGHALS
jgi:hypothetical protein